VSLPADKSFLFPLFSFCFIGFGRTLWVRFFYFAEDQDTKDYLYFLFQKGVE
jgi:hypothetical protein